MFDYNNGWEPYRIGTYNGEIYYKRYVVYWVRRTSASGVGDLEDKLDFAGVLRPFGLA